MRGARLELLREAFHRPELARRIKQRFGALLIGVRDPESGEHTLNPADAARVGPEMQLIYLAESAVLPPPRA